MAAFPELVKGSVYADPAHVALTADIVANQATRDDDHAQFAELFDAITHLLL